MQYSQELRNIGKNESLCEHIELLGMEIGQNYLSHLCGFEILENISRTISNDLINDLRISSFIAILLDESTDVNYQQFAVFYVSYLKRAYKKAETFLRLNYIHKSN